MPTYRVTVGGKEYQVEIEDVNARPVRAIVEGRVVQVWVPEQGAASPVAEPAEVPPTEASATEASATGQAPALESSAMPTLPSPTGAAGQPGFSSEDEVRAPMPGAIVSLAVESGDQVKVGQNLCVLDAMKMNNRIRSPRAGVIEQIHVNIGQQVQYGDLLMTFAD